MVYALLLERLMSTVATERQVTAVLLAAGAKKLAMPTYEDARAQFDANLCAEPVAVDDERAELFEAMGVGR